MQQYVSSENILQKQILQTIQPCSIVHRGWVFTATIYLAWTLQELIVSFHNSIHKCNFKLTDIPSILSIEINFYVKFCNDNTLSPQVLNE